MKFQTEITVVGMKASKGTMETGQSYDSTKAFVLLDMDATKGNMKGQSAGDFNIGLAAEFEKFKHLPFPFKARADMEIVTSGSTQKTIIHALQPVSAPK
jgi:hypothetical protein